MKYVIINSHCVLLDDRNNRRKMGLARYVESREKNLFKKMFISKILKAKRQIWLAEHVWG